MSMFKSLLLYIPIMIFYLIESLFLAIFVNTAWKYVLETQFEIKINYIHWVFIIWIMKILMFDILKFAININNNTFKQEKND